MPETEKMSGFRLNGWHALAIFVGLFAIVGGVNFYMVYMATTTLRGLDVSNAYERGVAYEKDVMAARAQSERQWNVDIAIRPDTEKQRHTVVVTAADKDNRALEGLTAVLVLTHPSDAGKDRPIALTETSRGTFAGNFAAEGGKWYLQLKLDQSGETKFRSRNSINLE